jgi:KUP system potassium uptake protein
MLTPLALRATVEELHELPERVIIVSIKTSTAAHVSDEHRITLDTELTDVDGISHVTLLYGFHDRINVPHALRRHLNPILTFDETQVVYFVSLTQVVATKRHTLASWRKVLYRLMARNALTASDYYKLPINRTEEMQSLIKL